MSTTRQNPHPIFESLQAADAAGLRVILEADPASAECRDAHGISLIMQALYRRRRDLAEMIAARKKMLDIFESASLGRLDYLKELAKDPAIVNSRSGDGFTALHFAGFFNQPESARVLLEAGAAVDAVAANPMAVMPLHSAATARDLETVRLLLAHGAPPNARQQGGWAPIHSAAQNGDRAMVEVLLHHGADPKQTNDEGKTAAEVARQKAHHNIADLLESSM